MLEYILNKRIEQVIEKTSNIPGLFPSLNKNKILKQLKLDFPRNLFLFDNIIIHNLTTFLNILTTYSRSPLEYLYLCILATQCGKAHSLELLQSKISPNISLMPIKDKYRIGIFKLSLNCDNRLTVDIIYTQSEVTMEDIDNLCGSLRAKNNILIHTNIRDIFDKYYTTQYINLL